MPITQTCPITHQSFTISDSQLAFYESISPTFAGVRFPIPHPHISPTASEQQRMAFRNERSLYKRKCDATGKDMISMHHPDKPYTIYSPEVWWSDDWTWLDYGVDFDEGRSFTDQFYDLLCRVPLPSLYAYYGENSSYCNCVNYQKNCYLTYASSQNESCMYASYCNRNSYCLDGYMTKDCEQCYETIDCESCYNCKRSDNCRNSSDLIMCENCEWSHHCIGCVDLSNTQYHYLNQPLSKEQYQTKLDALHTWGREAIIQLQSEYTKLLNSLPRPSVYGFNNENCPDSNHINNSKNSSNCHDVYNLEDCSNCRWFQDADHCHDCYSRWQNSSYCYSCVGIGDQCSTLLFCANVDSNSRNCYYSMHCSACTDCFGCIWLTDQQYCIFNKQYENKDKYEAQVAKIVQHMMITPLDKEGTGEVYEWWQFFHPSLSTFAYNESIAQDHYPLSKDTLDHGYRWTDYVNPDPVVDQVLLWHNLPNHISQVDDNITKSAIKCEISNKLFRIIPQELAFYRKNHIPLPRRHPDQRHLDRLARRK